jgi:hypothetical protein
LISRENAIKEMMSLGLLSFNESRALLGYEHIDGGEKKLQSLNFVDQNLY